MEGHGMAELKANELQPRAQEALQASPIYALRDVRVEQTGKQLMLTGRVSSFYHKQMAQELVLALAEDVEIVNTIHVG
jgi:hypothetical protein